MRILTVPNWSFGRNRSLERQFREVLERHEVAIHFLQGDVDHNRTVSAFSGSSESVFEALMELCALAFDSIDLNRHMGVHPRIGALDVCPFVLLDGDLQDALALAERVGQQIGIRFHVPVFLYEKSERGRHETDLPSLRKGGFGGLSGRVLNSDFGPRQAHERLGLTVLGVRDFLLAINVDLSTSDLSFAKQIAAEIRGLREEGDPRFLGVRSLGFPLASREQSQVSLNLTLPDLTPVDPIVDWILYRLSELNLATTGTELIGVIREQDVPTATRLIIQPAQLV